MSGDVTVECWVRPTAASTNNHMIWTVSNSNSDGHSAGFIRKNSNPDNMAITTLGVSQGNAAGEGDMERLDVWYHCAWVKEASPSGGDEETRFYFNGKRIYNLNGTSLWSAPTTPKLTIGKDYQSTNNAMYGYIADFHWTNSAKYTGTTYTVPTSPVSADANTVLRMNNKSDANIYDAASNKTFRLVNNTTTSTSQRKFSTSSSIYFDGTNDVIEFDNLALDGDLTIEGWFYQAVATDSNYRMLMSAETYGGSAPLAIYTRNAQLQGWANSSSASFVASSFSANTWHHCAVVRHNGTWKIYLDGTVGGTTTVNGTYSFAPTTDWRFGAWTNLAYDWNGYMQDWRISNRAVYTTNFTPPATEFDL